MVKIVVTSGTTDFTWNNTPYTWDNVPAGSTWDNGHITGHNIVAEYELAVQESFDRIVYYRRLFEDSLDIDDAFKKTLSKNLEENFNLQDAYIQNSASIIYDVVLRSAANVDLSKMRTIARQAQIAGYEEGVEFLPGDYEFKDAIVGVVITNNTSSKRVGFKTLDMYVDTPDIVDRGSIVITNSGVNYDPVTGYTTVYLNKPYHFVPNVIAAVVSGNELGDYIFDPEGFTNVSFRVKIVKKGESTTPTTGTLLWEAVGY